MLRCRPLQLALSSPVCVLVPWTCQQQIFNPTFLPVPHQIAVHAHLKNYALQQLQCRPANARLLHRREGPLVHVTPSLSPTHNLGASPGSSLALQWESHPLPVSASTPESAGPAGGGVLWDSIASWSCSVSLPASMCSSTAGHLMCSEKGQDWEELLGYVTSGSCYKVGEGAGIMKPPPATPASHMGIGS